MNDYQGGIPRIISFLLLCHLLFFLFLLFFFIISVTFGLRLFHKLELRWNELFKAGNSFVVIAESIHTRLHWLKELLCYDCVLNTKALIKYFVDVIPDQGDSVV